MTILIIGGTGLTGSRLARLLDKANHPVLLTSRSGTVPEPFKGVKFDWLDASTHENPFNADNQIDRIYMVGPDVFSMLAPMKPFFDLAISKGVKRFVFLSASILEAGGPGMGEVHEYLVGLGVDYCVLRPTWFIENFARSFLKSIRKDDLIASTTEDGCVPFISADDIAEVAFGALTDEPSHNTDHIIVGPELHTYDEACAIFSDVLGRTITHKRLTKEEAVKLWLSLGLTEEYANTLVEFESLIATGEEEKFFHLEKNVVGRKRLREYIEENREVWVVSE